MDGNERRLRLLIDKHRPSPTNLAPSTPTNTSGATVFENRLAVSAVEAAALLGLSVKTVSRLVRRGEIKARYAGRRLIIPVQAVEAWLLEKE